jgi:hypothetical protein
MASLSDTVLDAALNSIGDNCENLYICSAEPTTYAEASSTYKLGTKATPGFTGPAGGDVSGRKITVDAITDGAVSATDTATHWALTDNSLSELQATEELTAPQGVTSGNTFTLNAFDIEIPDPA